MPTTIAIQGEWGSGKTSMMNQMKHSLCEEIPARRNNGCAGMSHKTKADQIAKKIGSALAVVAKAAAKTAVSQTGIDGGEVVDGIVSAGQNDAKISALDWTVPQETK